MNNQKGLGAVGILITIIVVGLVGFAGWYVWYLTGLDDESRQRSTSQNQDQKSSEQNSKTEESQQTGETAGWIEKKNTEFGFSYKYPSVNEWRTQLSEAEGQAYADGARVHLASADYMLCGKNCGSAFHLSIYVKDSPADPGAKLAEERMAGNIFYKLVSKQNVKIDGEDSTRWEYVPGDDSASRIIFYHTIKGNLSYLFSINANGAKTDKIDITEVGEKILRTFRFLE